MFSSDRLDPRIIESSDVRLNAANRRKWALSLLLRRQMPAGGLRALKLGFNTRKLRSPYPNGVTRGDRSADSQHDDDCRSDLTAKVHERPVSVLQGCIVQYGTRANELDAGRAGWTSRGAADRVRCTNIAWRAG